MKYKREGCRCDVCTADHVRRQRQRDYLRATGRSLYVDATPVREHIGMLMGHGMTYPQIAVLSGVDRTSVRVAHRGHRGMEPSRRVRRENAAAILAVQPDPVAIVPGCAVNAIGIHRRIEALLADGWTKAELNRRLGNDAPNAKALQVCRSGRVRAATAAKVVALYVELVDVGGPSAFAARRYRGRGYAPPEAWTWDTIDDPWAWPAEVSPAREQGRREALAEDAAWLVEHGLSVELTAHRLGVTSEYAQQLLERQDVAS